MKVVRFDQSKIYDWNEFVVKAKNGLFLFERAYMDYHKVRFPDHSLMIYNKKDKLIALFPATEKGLQIYSHSGLTFGGLIMSYELKTAEVITVFDELIDYYRSREIREIHYKAMSYIFNKYPAQEDLYSLFRHDAILYRRDICSVIKISNPVRFSETKRQAIKKCIKEGVVISENLNFKDYWTLLTAVLAKFKTIPVHTLDEIHHLKKNFPEQIRLFEARLVGNLLAGIVIYDYGNVVHTQYMANSEMGRKLGALDFINFNLINEIYKNRKYFSFGSSTENQGRRLNEGLIQQKEMMGARAVCNDFYKIKII